MTCGNYMGIALLGQSHSVVRVAGRFDGTVGIPVCRIMRQGRADEERLSRKRFSPYDASKRVTPAKAGVN
jgi:hypothetical protein